MTVFTLSTASANALAGIGVRRPRLLGRSTLPASQPPRDPVRRDSREAGTFEEQFYAVPAKGETDTLLRVARRTLDAGRQLRREARAGTRTLSVAERRIAALTASAVRVYEELLTLARLNRGKLFPSYEHLAKATSLGRATVARALQALETIGFVTRQRRFRRVPTEGAGPRYKQTSNVYRAMLPQSVLGYLPRWMRPAPIPDDALQLERERSVDLATMRSSLSCYDLAATMVGGELGAMLAKLGAAIDRRDLEA